MERLTEWTGERWIARQEKLNGKTIGDKDVYKKLAAYEDTDMVPADVKRMHENHIKLQKDFQKVMIELEKYRDSGLEPEEISPFNKELVKSFLKTINDFEDLEKDGRLIKLPCKVGDEVYRITMGREIESCNVEKFLILSDGLYVAVFYKINKVGYISTYPVKELYFSREDAEEELKTLYLAEKLKGAEDENKRTQ